MSGVWISFGGEHTVTLPVHPHYSTAQHGFNEKVFYEEQSNVQW